MIKIKFLEPLTPEQQEKVEENIQQLLTGAEIEAKISNNETGNSMVSPKIKDED